MLRMIVSRMMSSAFIAPIEKQRLGGRKWWMMVISMRERRLRLGKRTRIEVASRIVSQNEEPSLTCNRGLINVTNLENGGQDRKTG